jgi:hypothetical protein
VPAEFASDLNFRKQSRSSTPVSRRKMIRFRTGGQHDSCPCCRRRFLPTRQLPLPRQPLLLPRHRRRGVSSGIEAAGLGRCDALPEPPAPARALPLALVPGAACSPGAQAGLLTAGGRTRATELARVLMSLRPFAGLESESPVSRNLRAEQRPTRIKQRNLVVPRRTTSRSAQADLRRAKRSMHLAF